jgi:hypothetical protein
VLAAAIRGREITTKGSCSSPASGGDTTDCQLLFAAATATAIPPQKRIIKFAPAPELILNFYSGKKSAYPSAHAHIHAPLLFYLLGDKKDENGSGFLLFRT